MSKELSDTPRVELVIAIEKNKAKRNANILFGAISLVLILFFGWSKWILLIPIAFGLGAFLFQMNIAIVSAELKRRSISASKEP